jgi:large subunit ribosomal protein L4
MAMAEIQVFDSQGKSVEKKQLEGSLFNAEVKPHLMHEYVVGFMRNQRHGNAATKTRTMVRGGGRKPWRQKGTGRSRSGSNTSPLWVGGGIVWGPHPKDHYSPMSRKLKKSALKSAFSLVAAEGRLRISELPDLEKPSARIYAGFLKGHDIYNKRVLLLYENKDENIELSCRNIKWLVTRRSILVNPMDLIWAEYVLITPDALAKIEEVFGK